MKNSKADQARHDAAVLPRIRVLQADGLNLREIASQLQADGLPTPGRVGRWSHNAVKRILERARKSTAPPSSATVSVIGPVTVTGPVNMTGPVTVTAAGSVTATGAPVTITEAESPAPFPPQDTIVELAPPAPLHAFFGRPAGETAYEMPLAASYSRRRRG